MCHEPMTGARGLCHDLGPSMSHKQTVNVSPPARFCDALSFCRLCLSLRGSPIQRLFSKRYDVIQRHRNRRVIDHANIIEGVTRGQFRGEIVVIHMAHQPCATIAAR